MGDRWTLLIVQALLTGPRRFNDLQEAIPGIAPNILSERLKRLERDALVMSRLYTERPPRRIRLDRRGQGTGRCPPPARALGARHAVPGEVPRHLRMRHASRAQVVLPTCDHLVEGEPEMETRFL